MEKPNKNKDRQRMKGGKGEMWVLGRWSRYMRFNKSSSKVEREPPLGGATRKSREKGFGIAFQSVF
jgi:hypothetical protein